MNRTNSPVISIVPAIFHHAPSFDNYCNPSVGPNNQSECPPLTLTSSLTVDANMSHTSRTTVISYNRAGDKTIDNASRDAIFEKNLADYKGRQAKERSAAAKLRSDTLQAGRDQENVTGKTMNFSAFLKRGYVRHPDGYASLASRSAHKEGPQTFTGTPNLSTSPLAPASTVTPSQSVAVQLTDDFTAMH
jgi:hypothetical protein